MTCGIYTRKSTDEGLDRGFNSLDVQREACAAYVESQKHEGWRLSPEKYDDGAYSGGNMKRPALQRLLVDVASGRIDVIVVYKIDRLTRSLADFAKIVEVLDAAEGSFVSITQSFNTSTSMGRLTLNVLLSFAQFERELGSERVRDKIAASKARGLWTGGAVPLGYDLVDHKLVVNPIEAALVRYIMETYLTCGSVPVLLATLEAEGVRTKSRTLVTGESRGGIVFRSGALRHLLRNETYLGRTKHRDKSYPGQHEAIVDEELWARVQALTASNAVRRRLGTNARNPSLLTGLIRDQFGRRMSPSYTCKGRRRYRYYVSNNATAAKSVRGWDDATPIWRIPAEAVEEHVRQALAGLFADSGNFIDRNCQRGASAVQIRSLTSRATELSRELPRMTKSPLRKLLLQIDLGVTLREDHLELGCSCRCLDEVLGSACEAMAPVQADDRLVIRVPASLAKRGLGLRLVLVTDNEGAPQAPDRALVKLIVQAHAAQALLFGRGADVRFAAEPDKRNLARLARLRYLAPDIVSAILGGHQPVGLTSTRLRRMSNLPLCWAEQRRVLDFPAIETIAGEFATD